MLIYFQCVTDTEIFGCHVSDSWRIHGASFMKWPCFSQVKVTVKYAWQKNKWGSLLRKCWCSRGTSVPLIYKSVLFATLMLHLLRSSAASRCTHFFLIQNEGCCLPMRPLISVSVCFAHVNILSLMRLFWVVKKDMFLWFFGGEQLSFYLYDIYFLSR